MLRSLNERVALEQAERQARLLAQMDSLYTGSVELNGRMNNMVSEFERENNERFTARYKAFVLERDNSYYMVVGLALSVSPAGDHAVYHHPPGSEPSSPVRKGA